MAVLFHMHITKKILCFNLNDPYILSYSEAKQIKALELDLYQNDSPKKHKELLLLKASYKELFHWYYCWKSPLVETIL